MASGQLRGRALVLLLSGVLGQLLALGRPAPGHRGPNRNEDGVTCPFCGCQSFDFDRCYWHLKVAADWWGSKSGLSRVEELFVGIGIPVAPHRPASASAHALLAAEDRKNEPEWRRLQGIRWLADIGTDERLELT
jgi:hypothetical protein